MSVDIAREFLAKIATDEDLAKAAAGLSGPALITLARQLGYVFDESQLQEATTGASHSDTLSDDDLRRVSGGATSRGTYGRG
jgi:predicted ribosomally synthesized peptide with nif11-like leader